MVERSPYFCFIRGGWVPAVWMRDPRTGFFDHVGGPDTFTTWREVDEVRFLRAKRPREAPAQVTKALSMREKWWNLILAMLLACSTGCALKPKCQNGPGDVPGNCLPWPPQAPLVNYNSI